MCRPNFNLLFFIILTAGMNRVVEVLRKTTGPLIGAAIVLVAQDSDLRFGMVIHIILLAM
jgi:hypothetical protein